MADLYTWALIIAITVGILAGIHLHSARPGVLHLARQNVPAVGAVVLAVGWALYLTRRRIASSPFSFSVAEVHVLLMAPLARADLFRQLARRRAIRWAAGVAMAAGALAVVDAEVLHGHGPLSFLGPIGSLATLAAGWIWSGYSHHFPTAARARGVATAVGLGGMGLAQPLAHLPPEANPLRVLLALAVAPSGSGLPVVMVAVGLVAVGGLGLWLATVWVPAVPIDTIARRAPLVSQLRYALVRGDTRAVSLLSRATSGEASRLRPWFTWRPRATGATGAGTHAWVATVSRTPLARLVRFGVLAGADAALLQSALVGRAELVTASAGGLIGYVLGLGLLEATAELADADELARTTPAPFVRLLGAQVLLAVLAALVLAGIMLAGVAPGLWLSAAVTVGVAMIAGPLLSLVLGPPSLEFIVQVLAANPLVAPLVGAARYFLGVLVTIVLTVPAMRTSPSLPVCWCCAVAGGSIVVWSVWRSRMGIGPAPSGGQTFHWWRLITGG